MINKGKHSILGIPVSALDYEAATKLITDAARERRSFAMSAMAVHGIMTGTDDSAHKARLRKFDMIVPDGMPVRWALNWLYDVALPDRVTGPDLTLKVLKEMEKEKMGVFLYGSTEEVLLKLEENLLSMFPGLIISDKMPSTFGKVSTEKQREIAAKISESGAQLVLVGLGCPRQEVWVYEHIDLLSMPMMAVGAAFDFHAGLLSKAPQWMQNSGLEWFYRLTQEPRRLWHRYLNLGPKYLWRVMKQSRSDEEDNSEVESESDKSDIPYIGYG